jgi:uncharacterized protein (TIGR00255 family)
MTAFARVSRSAREGNWVVEIRSVNHRFVDLSIKLPPDFYPFEDRIRELVQSRIARGKITLGISQDLEEEALAALTLDEVIARKYLSAIEKLQRKFRLSGKVAVGDVVQLPGLFAVKKTKELAQRRWPSLQKAIAMALRKLIVAKETEGRQMMKDIARRLAAITGAVQKINEEARNRSKACFEKMRRNVHQLMGEEVKDEERLLREVALLAEKSDITEEIVRMKSHLKLFRGRLKSKTEIGRELDFLCQEMHREVNTMASKAQLFEVSRHVVFVKGELEKIREQIQNVE